MHNPTDRITHTTAFVTPVVGHWLEREITCDGVFRNTCPRRKHPGDEVIARARAVVVAVAGGAAGADDQQEEAVRGRLHLDDVGSPVLELTSGQQKNTNKTFSSK